MFEIWFFQIFGVLSCVWFFGALWTAARQAPLPMEFSRQEYWSGDPFPILFWMVIWIYTGLPWWLRWKRICLPCRIPRFDPCVGKILWRREWQHTPVFLTEIFHGQRSLVAGYSPQGSKESDTTEWLKHTRIYTVYSVKRSTGLGKYSQIKYINTSVAKYIHNHIKVA